MRSLVLFAFVGCGTNLTPQPEPAPTLASCVPNRDGQITVDELPIARGATVAYYARSGDITIPAFTGLDWKLDEELADEPVVEVGPVALKDQWYAGSFSSGQFVVAADGDLDGIYHQDDQALWLDGTASQEENPAAGKTLVHYAQPLPVLRFPIDDGDTFSTTSALVDATIAGLPFVGTDTLDVDVTGEGRLTVPYVTFSPVMRVRTLATRVPSTGTPVVTKRTTIFMFECFGEIARAESKTNETAAEFTQAAYLRRFALGEKP